MENNIPQGYKDSPLGIIPMEWGVRKLGEVCKVNQGLQIPIEKRLVSYIPNSYKYITIQYLNKAKAPEYILNPNDSVLCKSDDVLMTRTGNTGIVVTNVDGVFHNNFFKINFDRTTLNKDYLVTYLTQPKSQHTILVKAGTSTIPDLNHKDFYSIYISLPPLPEQNRIAEVLSCWDAAIEKQIALVDALKRRKRALMQQLLTAKKRLGNFNEPWERVRLGEIGEFFSGGTPQSTNSKFYNGNIPFIKSGEIGKESTSQFLSVEGFKASSAKMVNIGDILYALYGATSGECTISKINGAINQAVLCIRTKQNSCFLTQLLRLNKDSYIKKFIQGGQGNLSAEIIKSYTILLPSLTEQTAIAEVLTASDKEIELTAKKLEILRTQKRGLMQILLSGKKRLKI